jgi:hypothetical protein
LVCARKDGRRKEERKGGRESKYLLFQNFIGIVLVVGGSSWYSQIQYQKMVDKEKIKAEQERKDREAEEAMKVVVDQGEEKTLD